MDTASRCPRRDRQLHGAPRQTVARFGKAAIRDQALPIAIFTEATKEGVEHDLLRLAPHGQQSADKSGEREFARTGEGVGKLEVPCIGGKLRRVDSLRELGEKTTEG